MKVKSKRGIVALVAGLLLAASVPVAVAPGASGAELVEEGFAEPLWLVSIAIDGRTDKGEGYLLRQIDAISTGLNDQQAIPRDGRFAIAITQSTIASDESVWGQPNAKTIVEMTQISSDADVVAVQTALANAYLPSGETRGSIYDGFERATYAFHQGGEDGPLSSVCQFGQGYPSSTRIIRAINSGRPWRYDFIAIGGNVLTSAANWSAVALGGTGFTDGTGDDLESAFIDACFTPVPRIRAIEVTQAIQNPQNDVVLIDGKATLVRVYVESVFPPAAGDSSAQEFRATLSGTQVNGYGTTHDPIESEQPFVYLGQDVFARRGAIPGSTDGPLEFVLPDDWTTDQTNLKLNIEGGASCTWVPSGIGASRCQAAVAFKPVEPLLLNLYLGQGMNEDGSVAVTTEAQALEQVYRLNSIMPVAAVDYDLRERWADVLSFTHFQEKTALWDARYLEQTLGLGDARSYDIAIQSWKSGGQALVGSHVASAGIKTALGQYDGSGQRNNVAHELGHSTGLWHVLASPSTGVGMETDYCGAEAPERWVPGFQTFPWFAHRMQVPIGEEPSPEGGNPMTKYAGIPVISALSHPGDGSTGVPEREEFWGYDSRFPHDFYLAIISPYITGDLMGYVNTPWVGGPACMLVPAYGKDYNHRQNSWITAEEYDYIEQHQWQTDEWNQVPDPDGASDATYVTGSISASSGAASFEATIIAPSRGVPTSNLESYSLVAYDASGLEIARTTPSISYSADAPAEGGNSTLGDAVFEGVLGTTGAVELRLFKASAEVGHIVQSAHAPTVSITSPSAGSDLGSAATTVSWEASDEDGDALTYAVMFSTDGEAWETLATGLMGTSFTVRPGSIAGTAGGAFLVAASDAFDTTISTVGELRVEGTPPVVVIAQPADGSTYWGQQSIVLDATGFDSEDGMLDSGATSWTSDVDGPITIEPNWTLRAEDLTDGVHHITATVADSDGNVATATSTITILREEPPDVVAWTVSFDSQGGTGVAEEVVVDGEASARPEEPTRPGYVFEGWATTPEGGDLFDFASAVTADTTLYAQWAIQTWEVAFDSQGGTPVDPQTINDGQFVAIPPDPTRTDYAFGGWYTAASGGEEWIFADTEVTADAMLHAHWTFMPGLLSDVKGVVAEVLLLGDGHLTPALSDLAAVASDAQWSQEDVPVDLAFVLPHLYAAHGILQCSADFAPADAGQSDAIAALRAVLAELDPEGASAPSPGINVLQGVFAKLGPIMSAYRAALRGESLRDLIESGRDLLALSADSHFQAAGDRLTVALDPAHWKNRNHVKVGDPTVESTLADVAGLLRCDVVGAAETLTAQEARSDLETAQWLGIWKDQWRLGHPWR